jgi:hypothetical protein
MLSTIILSIATTFVVPPPSELAEYNRYAVNIVTYEEIEEMPYLRNAKIHVEGWEGMRGGFHFDSSTEEIFTTSGCFDDFESGFGCTFIYSEWSPPPAEDPNGEYKMVIKTYGWYDSYQEGFLWYYEPNENPTYEKVKVN